MRSHRFVFFNASTNIMSSKQQQPIPDSQQDCVWDALEFVYNNVAAFSISPAALSPLMRDKELVAKVEDQAALINHSQILAKDVTDYCGRLKRIRAMHEGRTGSSTDGDDLMRSIQIHECYFEWCHSYENVILPTMQSLLDLFEAAGANVTAIKLAVPNADTAVPALGEVDAAAPQE